MTEGGGQRAHLGNRSIEFGQEEWWVWRAAKKGRGQTRGLDAETWAGEHWHYPVELTHKSRYRGYQWPGHTRELQWLLLLEQHVADSREVQARAWMWVIDRQFRI